MSCTRVQSLWVVPLQHSPIYNFQCKRCTCPPGSELPKIEPLPLRNRHYCPFCTYRLWFFSSHCFCCDLGPAFRLVVQRGVAGDSDWTCRSPCRITRQVNPADCQDRRPPDPVPRSRQIRPSSSRVCTSSPAPRLGRSPSLLRLTPEYYTPSDSTTTGKFAVKSCRNLPGIAYLRSTICIPRKMSPQPHVAVVTCGRSAVER